MAAKKKVASTVAPKRVLSWLQINRVERIVPDKDNPEAPPETVVDLMMRANVLEIDGEGRRRGEDVEIDVPLHELVEAWEATKTFLETDE